MLRSALLALALCAGLCAPASAQLALTTHFDSNNGGSEGGAFYFDLTVQRKTTLFALDCNFSAPPLSAVGLEVWMTPETRLGKQLDPNAWELVARDDGRGSAAGSDEPTRITLEKPLALKPGRYGVALIAIGAGHDYRDGAATYSDGFLALESGEASNAPFSGPLFEPRIWSGRLIYGPKSVNGPYLYAHDNDRGVIHGFLLDKKSGVPGQLLGSPFVATGGSINCSGNCQTLAADPKGRFVFASTGSGLAVLRKGRGGVLSEVIGSPFAGTGRLTGVGTWSRGSTLLVFAVAANGVLNSFAIDAETGAATLRPQSPSLGTAFGAAGIAVGNAYLYVANSEDATIYGFAIDAASGALQATPNSPYSIPGIEEPFNLALDAKQTLLAVNDCDDGSYGFAAVDRTTGALLFPTAIQGASSCSQVFGFSSKGVFYGGGDDIIDVIANGPTSIASPTMPVYRINLGLVAPTGDAVYFLGSHTLHHAPIDARLAVPIASQTTTLSVVFEELPNGAVLVAK